MNIPFLKSLGIIIIGLIIGSSVGYAVGTSWGYDLGYSDGIMLEKSVDTYNNFQAQKKQTAAVNQSVVSDQSNENPLQSVDNPLTNVKTNPFQ